MSDAAEDWLAQLIATNTRDWSEAQGAIFEWGARGRGNLIVRARAGTGKTTTILEMVARVPERCVLLAAFNKSIATELQSRVASDRVEAKTLHSLGYKYIRKNASVRIDENGERALDLARRAAPDAPPHMVNLISKLHTKARDVEPWIAKDGSWNDVAAFAAHFDLLPDEEWEERGWTAQRVCEAGHRAMVLAMERTPIIDFADMIFLPLVHGWVRPWFDMVVVDEAQDMTTAQLTLAVGACAKSGRICVVGDDRQAIYGFRGADSGSLDRLKAGLSAVELGLNTTYRCGKAIVALAAEIVPDFRAADTAHDGEVISLGFDKAIPMVAPGDFVLSRKNAPLVRVCMSLLKRGVRAFIKGRDVGKGVVALIRKLDADDVEDLLPKMSSWVTREIARAQKRLPEEAAKERCDFVIDQAAIITALADGSKDLRDLERRCEELFADADAKNAVMCSTVHRAKGLEADTVFLLRSTFKQGTGSVEEDNILYVAITRAKQKLVWVEGEL